ncbi:MAG TPA: T9SS type A sorting domain-containing protein [Ferruginibacter sp.]|nr:T9SS type A sorting domain-containing protein [Ferruginibacter sp.]HRE62215.1 T9SS type A sorting domain-containing protein [Ferruginibacter sp.]
MMKNHFLVAGMLMLGVLAQKPVTGQTQTPRYIQLSEAAKAFYEYLPQGYPTSMAKYPLILFVHGYGEIGQGTSSSLPLVLRNGIPKLINEGTFPTSFVSGGQSYRFIVLSPQFTGFPSVNDIHNILNYAVANYPVDINRIYLTGLSMGGAAAWYYPGYHTNFASRIAATVPICGATEASQTYANNISISNLPVWATHNNGDPTVNVSITNNLVSLINNRPSPPNPLAKKTIFSSNSHDAWSQTYNPSFKENGMNIYEWMLQYQRSFTVLPVSGLNFTAQAINKKSLLQWTTAAENNVAGFKVLRGADGVNFTEVGYITAKGINGMGASYSFNDNLPANGKNYYRLQVQDKDAASTYSEIRLLNLMIDATILINPNPVKETMHLQTNIVLQNATLQIYNLKGQQLLQKTISGNNQIPINLNTLMPGLYVAIVTETQTKQTHKIKFIKE